MRTMIAGIAVLLALTFTACNGGDEHANGDGNANGNADGNANGDGNADADANDADVYDDDDDGDDTRVRAEGKSTAALDDNNQTLTDGAARFSQAKKQLRVALSSFELTLAQAKTMTDLVAEMRMSPSSEPYLELTFTIKDPSQPLSPTNIQSWYVTFRNFGKGPMALNRPGAEGIQKMSGELTPGGTIQIEIAGQDAWEVNRDKRVYRWSLNHRVPVLAR